MMKLSKLERMGCVVIILGISFIGYALAVKADTPPDRVENIQFAAKQNLKTPTHTKLTQLTEIVTLTPTIAVLTPKIVRVASGNSNRDSSVIYVKQEAYKRGWAGQEWEALYFIIQKESSWNHLAVNKSSGACSLFQALPCSKIGGNWQDISVQTEWGLNYIKARYGKPSAAMAFWERNKWY